jgi:hypothetical protein
MSKAWSAVGVVGSVVGRQGTKEKKMVMVGRCLLEGRKERHGTARKGGGRRGRGRRGRRMMAMRTMGAEVAKKEGGERRRERWVRDAEDATPTST